MGIAHGHGDGGMDEDSLQTENVATGHHVVAVEDVSELPTCVESSGLPETGRNQCSLRTKSSAFYAQLACVQLGCPAE